MFEFLATQSFIHSLEKLDASTSAEIKKKLQFLAKQENPIWFAKKLKGYKNIFRFRSGNYRMTFELSESRIILLSAKHRKEIYKGL